MKPLILALCLLPVVAVAQSKDATKDVRPAVVSAIPKGSNTRLDILTQERAEIMTDLQTAISAHPKAANKDASLKEIERFQSNLKAIDLEIARAAKEPATSWSGANGAASPKRIPQEKADLSPVSQQPVEPSRYESWDIFHNFGNKGN